MKKAKLTCLIAVILAIIAVISTVNTIRRVNNRAVSGWGDNGGGRPSYTLEQINADILKDKIVLNSISNSVNGNEKNFVSAREYNGPNPEGIENVWNTREIEVKDGQEYIIRAYIHNNNPYAENIAENVMIAFSIPTDSGTSIPVYGFITSDNAEPGKYWDGVTFTSDSSFHLEYVYESAYLYNNGIGAGGLQLSDEIVTKASSGGVLIGYYDLDGQLPGCYQYASYVAIRVKAVFDTDFRVSQKVRLVGDDAWHNYVDTKVGDKIEFQTQYQNTDFRDNTHENVTMKAILPKNLKYVPGSTILFTAATPDGAQIEQDTIVEGGISIGTYGKDANAYVRFTVEVVDENLANGTTGLVNWVQASVGQVTLQDFVTVRVYKE